MPSICCVTSLEAGLRYECTAFLRPWRVSLRKQRVPVPVTSRWCSSFGIESVEDIFLHRYVSVGRPIGSRIATLMYRQVVQ